MFLPPIKIVFIGDTCTGKTCIAKGYLSNHIETIAFDCYMRTVNTPIADKNVLKYQIWDIASKPEYIPSFRGRIMYGSIYGGAHAVMIVFDITNRYTFNNVQHWIEQVFNYTNWRRKDHIPILLVGNKCDLESAREVYTNDAHDFAEKHGIKYIETSAKTGLNISEVYKHLLSSGVQDVLESSTIYSSQLPDLFNKLVKNEYVFN